MSHRKQDRISLEFMEARGQDLARLIDDKIPRGTGFVLLLFQFGIGLDKWMTYVSNAQRADMIATLRELIVRLERREEI